MARGKKNEKGELTSKRPSDPAVWPPPSFTFPRSLAPSLRFSQWICPSGRVHDEWTCRKKLIPETQLERNRKKQERATETEGGGIEGRKLRSLLGGLTWFSSVQLFASETSGWSSVHFKLTKMEVSQTTCLIHYIGYINTTVHNKCLEISSLLRKCPKPHHTPSYKIYAPSSNWGRVPNHSP